MSAEYLAQLLKLISALYASGIVHIKTKNPVIEPDELDTARKVWYGVLYPELPLEKLEETVYAAIKAKSLGETDSRYTGSLRALTAGDVLRYWRDSQYQSLAKNRFKGIVEQKTCACNDTGYISVYSPVEQALVRKPCPFHAGLK